MNKRFASLLLASLPFTATPVLAQDEAPAMPRPNTAQHEHLKMLVGTWKTVTETPAMPGVPGMEKASTSVGFEHGELICNGLWLKVTGEGECNGEHSSGIWLLGYDSIGKTYQCTAVSSMDEAAYAFDATYDEKTKTWNFKGDTPMGPMRSVLVMESDDRCVETAYMNDPDGKEVQCMKIVRTRTDKAMPATAAAASASAKEMPAARAAMFGDLGEWNAAFTMVMPGIPAMTSPCKEVIEPICGNTATWSTFTGNLMGAPMEGHALTVYDSRTEKVTCFWMDSMSTAYMRTDGTFDEKAGTFSMAGRYYNEQGQLDAVSSKAMKTGEDERTFKMMFGEGDAQSVMTIVYTRPE